MSTEINIELEDVKVKEFFKRLFKSDDIILRDGDRIFHLQIRSAPVSASAAEFLKTGTRRERD